MAYLEFQTPDTGHYYLQDPIIYNRPGEPLFKIRVDDCAVELYLPFWKSYARKDALRRLNKIRQILMLKKGEIKLGTFIRCEQNVFVTGGMRETLVYNLIVKKPISRDLKHTTCGIVYHKELMDRDMIIYPKKKEKSKNGLS